MRYPKNFFIKHGSLLCFCQLALCCLQVVCNTWLRLRVSVQHFNGKRDTELPKADFIQTSRDLNAVLQVIYQVLPGCIRWTLMGENKQTKRLLMCLLRAVQKTVSAEQYVINIVRSLNAASKGAWEGKYKINSVLWAARNCRGRKGRRAKELVCGCPWLKSAYVRRVGAFSSRREFCLCLQSSRDWTWIINREKSVVIV